MKMEMSVTSRTSWDLTPGRQMLPLECNCESNASPSITFLRSVEPCSKALTHPTSELASCGESPWSAPAMRSFAVFRPAIAPAQANQPKVSVPS